ncbi:MAG: hypothetical protein LBG60_11425 [Bifidobacteriaceae bacterium]|jgi:hypothetical protein|nr:hypothetical protein [Bifidobacteriaceae bacterium]
MARNTKQMDGADLRRLLGKLDEKLVARGGRASMYVVGGANIALSLDARRTTFDIDAVIQSGRAELLEAAKEVAAGEDGLGEDWPNTAFTDYGEGGITWQWFDRKELDQPTTAFQGRALTVELASPEMMLALKTLAGRPQDWDDAYKLMRLTGIRTPEQLGRNLARFTGERIFRAQGGPGMFLRIDPEFKELLANAPADLRPPARPARREAGGRCRLGRLASRFRLGRRPGAGGT